MTFIYSQGQIPGVLLAKAIFANAGSVKKYQKINLSCQK